MKRVAAWFFLMFSAFGLFASEHFIFEGYLHDITEEIIQRAEQHYSDVCTKLDLPQTAIITFYVHPDLQSFHQAMNLENVSDWWIIGSKPNDDVIHMITFSNSGSCHDGTSVKKAFYAQIAQRLFLNKLEQCHMFQNYQMGISFGNYSVESFPESQAMKERFKRRLSSLVDNPLNISISRVVENSSMRFFEKKYKENNKQAMERCGEIIAIRFSLFAFVIENYGYDKLIELIDSFSIEDTFSMTVSEFETLWLKYTKSTILPRL